MPYESLVPLAGQYYQALYDFNIEQVKKSAAAALLKPNPEPQYKATLRLLEERPTESDDLCALHPVFFEPKETPNVPVQLAPGLVPIRSAGRQPKCFFALFTAFVAMPLMGKPAEPETVHKDLQNNPAFTRTCGFSLPSKENGYRQSDIPTLRKVEQFDQIMTSAGLWSHAAVAQVKRNVESGKIIPENTIVHDTTHYDAFSSMHTVHKEEVDGSIIKKSQSATIKNCRCADWHNCPHEWISADAGAGTVTKTGGIMHWAHKASTLGFAEQGILIDAIAMADAASHDSTSVVPQLARVFELYPELKMSAKVLLDDGAADDGGLKRQVEEEFGIKLLAGINPRGRKPLTTDLPKGMDHITPSGTPICHAGYPFDLLGVRTETDKFIFRAPDDANGNPVCHDCDR